jgi:hypothetical protein
MRGTGARGRRDPALQHGEQRGRLERLGHVVVHADGHALVAIARHRMRGQCHDRHRRVRRVLPDQGRRLVAVHHGHLDVHQHDIERRLLAHRVHRFLSVARERDPHARHLRQQLEGDEPVELVVLHQQHAPSGQQRRRLRRFHRGRRAGPDAVAARRDDGVEQRRRPDRLGDAAVQALGGRAPQDLVAVRRDEHDPRLALGRERAADALGGFEAVHARHLPVQQHEVVRRLVRLRQLGQRRGAAGHEHRGIAQLPQQALQDLARRGAVVDHQDAQPGRRLRGVQCRPELGAPDAEHGGEVELGACAGAARHADLAAHQCHELLRDRQAKARAAMAPRARCVDLAERPEQPLGLRRRHADAGVAHGQAQRDLARRAANGVHGHEDLALLGELHGIAAQVDEHLLERSGSPTSTGGTSPRCRPAGRALLAARTPTTRDAVEHVASTKSRCSMSSRPASIFEKSRMSLMMRSSESAAASPCARSRAGAG